MPTPNDVVLEYRGQNPNDPAVLELDKAQADFDTVWDEFVAKIEPYQEALNDKWRAVLALAEKGQS